MTQKIRYLQALVAITSVVLCLFIATSDIYRGHYTGDGASNDDAFTAGKNFNTFGFLKLRFASLQSAHVPLDTDFSDFSKLPKNIGFYTHYPAGNDIVQGILFKLGFESRFSHQLFALFISLIGSLLAWLVLSQIFSKSGALFSWIICILSPSFLFFSDSLYGSTWFYFFQWLFLFWILKFYKNSDSSKLKNIGMVFLFGLLPSWFSFDLVPGYLILGLIPFFLLPQNQRLSGYGILLLLAAPLGEITGFTLHILKNAWILGGLKPAISDLWEAFMLRSASTNPQDVFVAYSPVRHLAKFILGLQWFFTLPIFFVACLGWVSSLSKKPLIDKKLIQGLFYSSLIGAFFWQITMRQHSMVHAFTIRNLSLFIILGSGFFWDVVVQRLFKKRLWIKSVAVSVVLFLVIHSGLCVAQIEGVAIKRSVIESLIPANSRANWACIQKDRLSNSLELSGAKQLVMEWSKDINCEQKIVGLEVKKEGPMTRIAELVLFWR